MSRPASAETNGLPGVIAEEEGSWVLTIDTSYLKGPIKLRMSYEHGDRTPFIGPLRVRVGGVYHRETTQLLDN